MRVAAVALLALLAAAAPAAPAAAQSTVRAAPAGLTEPARYDRPPPGRERSAREVLRTAAAQPPVRRARAEHPGAYARAYEARGGRWQASFYVPPRPGETTRHEVAQVVLDDRTGRVVETWTGVQVEWQMARGLPGAFGRAVNAPVVWIGCCVLFALPFLRGPLGLLHLDLAVLLAFSVSYALFGAADLALSVPSAYPLLAYLLARTLLLARARARGHHPAVPRLRVGPGFLVIAIAFLVAFRVVLNVTNGNVIDVGYASVIGADRMAVGAPLYGAFPPDNLHGDTYGPVTYAAYVPFEAVLPWGGTWDELPAAHAAALAFDLGCALLLWLLGRRLRGQELGLLLAYLWLTFPFGLMVLNASSNDALVPLLVLAALLAAARPAARGALIALAGLTKLAPLALAPLFAGRPRPMVAAAAFALTAVLVLAPFDLHLMWGRTLGFQNDRESPFSIWGWYGLPAGLQLAAQLGAAALALLVAFVPRRRDVPTLAALAAAVLIALQLAVEHWFYLYLVWFAPLVWIALLSPPGAAPARSRPPGAAPSSG